MFICSVQRKLLFLNMKNTITKFHIGLLLLALSVTTLAASPPLLHRLPSGTTLVLAPAAEADYVTIQIFIDKRSFKNDILKQIYVNAYFGNIEQKLAVFKGVAYTYPMEPIPESIYDPLTQQYLNFKISSLEFNRSLKKILSIFLGKETILGFPLKGRSEILEKARLINWSVSQDSVKKVVKKIKFNRFKTFVNSVSLRQKVYLYIAGNLDLFRTVNAALKVSLKLQNSEDTIKYVPKNDSMDWYWSFVFWRFSLETLKSILPVKGDSLPLRLYIPLSWDGRRISVRLLDGYQAVGLSDSLADELQRAFDSSFTLWYRRHYFHDLKWMYDDADQKGFLRLCSTVYAGQPDVLFTLVEQGVSQALSARFKRFVGRLFWGGTDKR